MWFFAQISACQADRDDNQTGSRKTHRAPFLNCCQSEMSSVALLTEHFCVPALTWKYTRETASHQWCSSMWAVSAGTKNALESVLIRNEQLWKPEHASLLTFTAESTFLQSDLGVLWCMHGCYCWITDFWAVWMQACPQISLDNPRHRVLIVIMCLLFVIDANFGASFHQFCTNILHIFRTIILFWHFIILF